MTQPVFKHTSFTPPAVFQPVAIHFSPVIPQTYTPHYKNQEVQPPTHLVSNRPTNYLNFHAQQSQSYIFPVPNEPTNHNRTLQLQSLARKGNFTAQNATFDSLNAKKMKTSESIERKMPLKQVPSFITQNNKKPLYASELFTNQDFHIDLNVKKAESSHTKPVQPSFLHQSRRQPVEVQMSPAFKNPYEKFTPTNNTQRQCARNVQGSFPGNNLKFRQLNPPQKLFPKNDHTFLDSTQNSSLNNSSGNKMNESLTNKVKANVSPVNFWPLSISPCQQKRQTLGTSGITVAIENRVENKPKPVHCPQFNQFKKKKLAEFATRQAARSPEYQAKNFKLSDFELLDKIGKGSFGDVFMATEKVTGFMVVLKKLNKRKIIEMKLEQQLFRQIKIQSFLKHRHLTSMYGFFSDESQIYLILEIMPDGSLMQVKKKRKIPESQAAVYIRQICEGLKYMHTEEIIHRDIKPENIFLFEDYAKIGDFGCSIFTQSVRNTVIGSLAYISPEQLKQGSYDQKIDVWSLGVMAYEMLVGKSPYQQDIIKIAKNQIAPLLPELKFPPEIQLSAEAKDFVQSLLSLNPDKRIGIAQAIKHEFIQKHSRNDICS